MVAKMPEKMLVDGVRAAATAANQLVELIPPDLKLVETDDNQR